VTKLYVAQIPKHFKVSRGTLYRDIRKGRISAETNDKGRTLVDLSELERVYQPRQKGEASQTVTPGHYEADQPVHENSVLRREVELLRERLAENAGVIEDLRTERDRLITLIEEQATTVKLLTDERQQEPKPKRRWWWRS
jgi:regulator of replication initiation timing